MTFSGWPPAAIDFFDGLEEDNSREYWLANRSIYDDAVRRPMEELLADLQDEFGESKIFRPNRDVRFSQDKSPYKTTIAATLAGGGYVQLSAAGLAVGSGMYWMAPDQLERFRAAIDAARTGTELEGLVAERRAAGVEVTAHDALRTAPRGYTKDHPRIELLRLKGLVAWREWPAATWLATRRAESRVVESLRGARPLLQWLDDNVGPSTLPEPARR
ncbi:MAG: DUF2461 domain-containing protein [Acidimicrobiales bacterium]